MALLRLIALLRASNEQPIKLMGSVITLSTQNCLVHYCAGMTLRPLLDAGALEMICGERL